MSVFNVRVQGSTCAANQKQKQKKTDRKMKKQNIETQIKALTWPEYVLRTP